MNDFYVVKLMRNDIITLETMGENKLFVSVVTSNHIYVIDQKKALKYKTGTTDYTRNGCIYLLMTGPRKELKLKIIYLLNSKNDNISSNYVCVAHVSKCHTEVNEVHWKTFYERSYFHFWHVFKKVNILYWRKEIKYRVMVVKDEYSFWNAYD